MPVPIFSGSGTEAIAQIFTRLYADKYEVDVDDIFEIADILPAEIKQQYSLLITQGTNQLPDDEIHLGYFKLSAF